jgi:hypothetical protein
MHRIGPRQGAGPDAGNGLRADYGSESMAHDPLSHVASWLTPASADVTDKPPPNSAPGDDPALVLIAEMKRLDVAMEEVNEQAVKIFATLPEDVRNGRVRVSFSDSEAGLSLSDLAPGGCSFRSEEHMQDFLRPWRRFEMRIAERDGKDPEAASADFDREIGFDQALAQLRAGKAEIAAVLEASGYSAAEREGEELANQGDAVFNRLSRTKPTTLAGVIAMLEIPVAAEGEYGRELIEPALAGLREIAAKL